MIKRINQIEDRKEKTVLTTWFVGSLSSKNIRVVRRTNNIIIQFSEVQADHVMMGDWFVIERVRATLKDGVLKVKVWYNQVNDLPDEVIEVENH